MRTWNTFYRNTSPGRPCSLWLVPMGTCHTAKVIWLLFFFFFLFFPSPLICHTSPTFIQFFTWSSKFFFWSIALIISVSQLKKKSSGISYCPQEKDQLLLIFLHSGPSMGLEYNRQLMNICWVNWIVSPKIMHISH